MRFVLDYLNNPKWHRQHRWRRAIWNMFSRVGLTGLHTLPLSSRWVEVNRRPMPLRGLCPSLQGMRIVQLSDLHYSPVVWQRYLLQLIRWVNDLEPDMVVITGDLITGGYRYAPRVASVLSHLRAPVGVVCTFGNHDYGMYGRNGSNEGIRRGDYLEKCLTARGLIVLRNQAIRLHGQNGHRPLHIVGLDDEWSGHIDADRAFADVDPASPILCLNHNPANAPVLMPYPWQWMLSGHTHGRQIGTSRLGRALLPHRYRHFIHGYYSLHGRHLYVNRGLSYGQRLHEWCRPEITVFRLERADDE